MQLPVYGQMQSGQLLGLQLELLWLVTPWIYNVLKYKPLLVNAHFGGTYASYIIKSFFQFQSYLSQLETPVLDLKFQVSM